MRFKRLDQLLGTEKRQSLADKTVLIVGLGGVGGSAAESIARSGFGTIILVDKDTVDEHNINRQIIAFDSTINLVKVDIMATRMRDINPELIVIPYHVFYNHETEDMIWENNIDYVIDCIDTVTYKIDLIKECVEREIPFISVMGTGNKFFPDKLEVIPLSQTEYDPIARVIRQKLRKTYKLHKIMVVASKEPPQKVDSNTTSPSSSAFVPNTAGYLAASYIFNHAIGKIT